MEDIQDIDSTTNQNLNQEIEYQKVLEKLFANIKNFPEFDAILSNTSNESTDEENLVNVTLCTPKVFLNHPNQQIFTFQL